ncbi:phospholipid carrier-dependent glycosyltransferase [Candidatus Micrarchaeota archaeon]|nr:phospholipid carrier-dependent glycosyltransferase [Candidatus Micrarchaeota archaeon]
MVFLLAGVLFRADLYLLPMNDEVLYAFFSIENQHRFLSADPNPEHPPLAKWFLGLPTQFMALNADEFSRMGTAYSAIPPVPFVEEMVWAVLPSMRLVSLIFSLLLALLVYFIARRWLGPVPALLPLFIMLFSPNLLLFSNAVMLEMVFLFFFTAAILVYLFEYAPKRDVPRLVLLSVLLLASVSSKFYGFSAVVFIGLMELLRYFGEKKWDARLWGGLGLVLTIFIAVSYSREKVLYALRFYFEGNHSLNLNLLLVTLTRTEPLLYFLGFLSLYLVWKSRVRDTRVWALMIFLVVFLISIAFNPYPFFRHALVLWPFLALLSGWAFAHASALQKQVAIALAVLLFLNAVVQYPYYDSYSNALGFVFSTPPVERTAALGVHAFLQTLKEPMVTDDAYAIPFAHEYDARFFWHRAFDQGFMTHVNIDGFRQAMCRESYGIRAYLYQGEYEYFVRRVDGLQQPSNCDALTVVLRDMERVYSDPYFEVYDLR